VYKGLKPDWSGTDIIYIPEAEALAIATARKALIDNRLPEVYGVYSVRGLGIDRGRGILMQKVKGRTLESAWPSLSSIQKRDMCLQLKKLLRRLQLLSRPRNQCIGTCVESSAERGCSVVLDPHLTCYRKVAECNDETAFNEFLIHEAGESRPPPDHRSQLDSLQSHQIVFTHGDISPSNIIVEQSRIVGLIDWEFSGWYPEYWEYLAFMQRYTRHSDWYSYAPIIFRKDYEPERRAVRSLLGYKSHDIPKN
jgi:serine/threonine protein kinase